MKRTALLLAAGAAVASGIVLAGPLSPPAGSVASTYRTLSEIEPRIAINAANTPGDADSLFRITSPGSYYLTGSVQGVAGKSGIEIAVGGVSVDLAGFTLQGTPTALQGITISGASPTDIVVTNGTITGWGSHGMYLSSAANLRIEGVVASANGGTGIMVGDNAVISNCSAAQNTGGGISAHYGATIRGCTADQNTAVGIWAENAARITDCVARSNGQEGFVLFAAGSISGCAAFANTLIGINSTYGCSICGNTCTSNPGGGIRTQQGTTIRDNTCTANGNGTNSSNILVAINDCRIEGNNCAGGDYGVRVFGSGNVIVRNTCSGHTTNWSLAAGNVLGPIIDRTAPGSAAVSGNSAPDSTGSTHPNANFTY